MCLNGFGQSKFTSYQLPQRQFLSAALLPLRRGDNQTGQAMKVELVCGGDCLTWSPQPAPLGQELEFVCHIFCKTWTYANIGHPSIALGCWQTGRVLGWYVLMLCAIWNRLQRQKIYFCFISMPLQKIYHSPCLQKTNIAKDSMVWFANWAYKITNIIPPSSTEQLVQTY